MKLYERFTGLEGNLSYIFSRELRRFAQYYVRHRLLGGVFPRKHTARFRGNTAMFPRKHRKSGSKGVAARNALIYLLFRRSGMALLTPLLLCWRTLWGRWGPRRAPSARG